jgi:chitodextrinase
VTLTWNGVAGAASYQVYYKMGTMASTADTQVPASAISGTMATVSGLTNGTQYAFVVTAHNTAGSSVASSAALATPKAATTAPSMPTNVQATSGDGQVTITWTVVTGAASYHVYYKAGATASITDSEVAASAISGTTATVTGLTAGTQYAFVVTAYNTAGTSGPSSPVTATPTGTVGSLSLTLTGGLLGNFTVTFSMAAGQAIGAPDTSGSYPVYVIPRSSLPLTVTASSSPTATGHAWFLDTTALSSTGTSVQLTAATLSARKHNLTLQLNNGTDPNRSATIILDATN